MIYHNKASRVVVFSTDRNILNPDSAVAKRQQAYAKHFDSYDVHIVRAFNWGNVMRSARTADVISVQDPFETGALGFLFALFFRKPLHVQVHTDFYAKGFMRAGFRNRLKRFIAPFILRRAKRIRVVSELIKELIEKKVDPKASITVLPIFVDTERFQNIPRIKHGQFKIALLVVARLEKEKNVALAIWALKTARDSGHDAGLTIVGSGSELEKLKEQSRSLGLERFVVFTGEGNPIEQYASADAVLVPSHYEGYGMVIVEALSAGIPVISTDVGIARESGAMVTSEKDFPHTLIRWIESGTRQATLTNYQYKSFEEYVRKYCDDIKTTI
jgi:glycosyltransferase involved in cell wall biosynthesis